MVKLYLASFLESENFGPGRVISIANGDRPEHIKCEDVFTHLIPNEKTTASYQSMLVKNSKNAANMFVKSFTQQLNKFYDLVILESSKASQTPQETLPFKGGDTLCSWERKINQNYRKMVAAYLERLGYEVVCN